MKRTAKLVFSACLTAMSAVGPSTTSAAQDEPPAQTLVQENNSGQMMAAHWIRMPDAFVLRVVIDQPQPEPAYRATTQSAATDRPPPREIISVDGGVNRSSFFIGNTIESLRNLNPAFSCRTLTLVDGRRGEQAQRPVGGQQPAPAHPDQPYSYLHQPSLPGYKDPRVDVWLLKGDGSQVLGATYSCEYARVDPANPRRHLEVSYEFPLAGIDQAVAAAIRIDDRFFIEKLQQPPAQ